LSIVLRDENRYIANISDKKFWTGLILINVFSMLTIVYIKNAAFLKYKEYSLRKFCL